MTNHKVYLHEYIDITLQQRARYMHHMTAHWVPRSRKERMNQLCFGVWGTFGSTGRWPQVVNMWEYDSWDHVAAAFDLEASAPTLQDATTEKWWNVAGRLRSGGTDCLMVPAPWTKGIEELCADGVRGHVYNHEVIQLPKGNAREFMEDVRDCSVPAYEGLGARSVGVFRTVMRADTECLMLWAFPDMKTWAGFESAWSDDAPELRPWRQLLRENAAQIERIMLVDSPLSPMRIGRQPGEEDQRPLEDFFPPEY